MGSRSYLRVIGVLMVGALMSALAAHSTLAASPAYALDTPGIVDSSPRTNGQVVVWSEERSPGAIQADVLGENVTTGQTFTVAGGPDNQIQPDIDGNIVVWLVVHSECPPCDEIHARDIGDPNSTEFVVAGPGTLINAPVISGHWVVWESGNAIMARDISAMTDPMTVVTPEPGWSVDPVAINGERIVWDERSPGPNHTVNWQIKTRHITQADTEIVAAGIFLSGQSIGYALRGNLVVYTVASNDPIQGPLVAVDVGTGSQTTIAEAAAYPSTDGRYIFWQTTIGQRVQLLGFDRQTQSTFEVPSPAFSNGMPDLAGGALVWLSSPTSDFIGATMDIGAAWLSDVLPTGARPDPGTTSPDWFYFPESSHYLAYGFKNFWVRSGGLPVFGFPLTEEYTEVQPGGTQAYTVQYFERQRFEYHPELAGTPYETELGRLGWEDATARNLVVTRPFQPATPDSAAGCRYFSETEHSVCGAFLAYWQSHGLDFGDPGYSFRESLALFGYPISEPYVDPQTGLMVQYFERARFEWHPENAGTPYEVLLGRLGADQLARHGWS